MQENTAELYEYPSDYVGRKSYVSVAGHSRSVPKYKTYLGTDRRRHLLPEYGGNFDHLGGVTITVIPDKAAYHSPIDNTIVDGRMAHREHMRRHDVIEAGDMQIGSMWGSERAPMPHIAYDIKRAIEEVSSR